MTWRALAVSTNAALSGRRGKIIRTKNEKVKAECVKGHWSLLGNAVTPWIELEEGDVWKTFRRYLPEQVHIVLLDSELDFLKHRFHCSFILLTFPAIYTRPPYVRQFHLFNVMLINLPT
jgi:hypothetical protein